MRTWAENKYFQRTLEIIPGLAAWAFIVAPMILAFVIPAWVAVFILVYAFYFLVKALNIARHMIAGYGRLNRNMKLDWLERLKLTTNTTKLEKYLSELYDRTRDPHTRDDLYFIKNLTGASRRLKKWEGVTHVVLFAVSKERLDILEPSVKSVLEQNYPMDKVMVVLAAEDAYRETFLEDWAILKKKYGRKFKALKYYLHVARDGEVRPGKGPNITSAGKAFWAEFQKKGLSPADTLVTNLDADHIMHPEYLANLTYHFVVDPNRDKKTYQPVPLLFNNIWDSPAMNRVAAVSSSFWQIVESMRTFRLRTFAAHTQSLKMLLLTDFWSITTIVEDGHQYWRTYFALNGDHQMVALSIPVYQDAVLGGNWWESFKNQYFQKRRWAWGVSDFPYVVTKSIQHPEIPLHERFLQLFRLFSGHFVWATSSFVMAISWIPLTFNKHFQDTVLAHNISMYSSAMLRLAWIGIILNVWISIALFPPRPKKYGPIRSLSMILMWVLSPVYAVLLSALPALEAQTRLLLGKKLEFFIVPKHRISEPENRLKPRA